MASRLGRSIVRGTAVSRRRRSERKRALRARLTETKQLRRRARGSGLRRAGTATTAAALGLAGLAPTAALAAPAPGTSDAGPRQVGSLLAPCSDPTTPPSSPENLVDLGGVVFFTADDGIHGQGLWKSDGTSGGTVLVKDLDTGDSYYGGLDDLVAVGDALFFTVDNSDSGGELWTSDGTAAGMPASSASGPIATTGAERPGRGRRHPLLQRRRRRPWR